jgi:excisionase family DNA binding protein
MKGAELLAEQVVPEWVSYPEAERFSGLSHTSLWRRVRSGEIKSARVGRSVRINLPSLREFMERASEEAVEQ